MEQVGGNPRLDQPELCKHLIPMKGLGTSPTKNVVNAPAL